MKNFPQIAESLKCLLRIAQTFTWKSGQQEAFQLLNRALISAPVLGYFFEHLPTDIHADGSRHSIDAVLLQRGDGVERAVGYATRSLTLLELNYSASERECPGVVWAVSKFRTFFMGDLLTL